jgi:hypothetical protein
MPQILYPPSRPQSVGEVLDTGFRIYSSTLVKCLPYSFASVIIGQLLSVYNLARGYPLVQTATARQLHDPGWGATLLVLMLLGVVVSNAILLRQSALAGGGTADMRAELARAVRRLPGTLLIWLLTILALFALFVPALIAGGVLLAAAGRSRAVALALGVLCTLGVCWLAIRWVCAVPGYLLGERGAVESMAHSWHLTAGNFWRLSAIFTVGVILLIVFYMLASVVGGIVAMQLAHGDVNVTVAASAAIVALLAALFTPFYYALWLAVVGDLSVRREGSDLAQRLSVSAAQ